MSDPAPTTLLTDMFEALTPDQQDLFRNRLRAATAPPKTIEELLDMYHRGSIPVNRVYEILNGTHS